jgi:RNA polymerase sigma-70 factor (ECF subfamily)
LDEQRLINGCIKGDAFCQRELVERYSSMLYTIALRYLGNADDSKDLLQESFIKIFKALPDYKENGRFEGWMRTIVISGALNVIRSNKKWVDIDDHSFQNSQSYSPGAYADLGAKELLKLVQRLPEKFRVVFNLAVLEEYNHDEIANELNISEATSRSLLFRARQRMRQMIEELEKVQL